MKKITSTISFLFLGCAIFAQTGAMKVKPMTPRVKKTSDVATANVNGKQQVSGVSTQAAFFTDDFSNPATWTVNSPSGNGNATAVWQFGTTGPVGTYKIPPINSTTHANGFALFDSDQNCSGNQIADMTTASPINCSAHPFINLSFQEQYRRWFDSTFVFVSNNNTTWTKYVINKNFAVKDITPNPTTVKIDISAVAGGQATVWVRFEFYAPSTLTTNSPGCGYSMMIDDVALTDLPTNDIGIDKAYADFYFKDGGFYTQTPVSQITPMTFRAAVSNLGSAAQTNNNLTVKISNGASTVYNQTGGAITTLAYTQKDTIYDTLTPFTPAAVAANYTARWSIAQTQVENPADTMNNSVVMPFAVSDTVFARDNGILGRASIGPVDYTGGDGDGSAIGNLFLMSKDGTIGSVSAMIDSLTAVGTTIQYKIMRLDSAGGFNEIAATAVHTVSAKATTDKWLTMAFPTALPVLAGNYVAAVFVTGQVAGTTTTAPLGVFITEDKTTPQPKSTTFIYTASATTPSWGYITYLPMIRMNILKGPAGIKENANELTLVSAFPNPATRTISINYSVSKVSNVVIDIYDIAGKKMDSFKETAVNGTRVSKVDLSTYAAGTYFYSVTSDNAKLNGKFVVNK
jgi:hypothetical protein